MDDFLRDFISKKWRIGSFTFTFLDVLLAVCISGTGVFLRLSVIDYTETGAEKIAGIVLEYLLAILCGAIVYHYTGRRNRAFCTYAILVIYPTIVANGALWKVNCVYYVILFFAGFYLCVRGFRVLGVLSTLAGTAIALYRMWQWYQPLSVDYPASLSRGWPNFYEIIGAEAFVNLFDKVFVLFLIGLLLTGAYGFAKKKIRITQDMALQLFLFLALLIPYFAPYMPAWAGYTADIAALLYCMRRKERFYLPILQLIVSYSAYAYIINGETKLPMVTFSVILIGVMVNVGVDLYREVSAQLSERKPDHE